jgi:dethiobiotin synthetase
MARGFFVTGTDTGVGKTVVAAALIRLLKSGGMRACGMKPVETGCERKGGELLPLDGAFLAQCSESAGDMENITPLKFQHPLAPMAASRLENKEVDLARLKTAFNRLSEKYDALVVEGIGGLLVPLTGDYFVIDLARDMGLPLIIVISPFLGTINHTLLTVRQALSAGLETAGVVINYSSSPRKTLAEDTNPQVLRELCPVPVLGVMPYLPGLTYDALEKAARENLDLAMLKKYL